MSAEAVLDASVAFKCFFPEHGSEAAQAYVGSVERLVAPDLIITEFGHAAAKNIRRGGGDVVTAQAALEQVQELLFQLHPTAPLVSPALTLAAEHGLSVYDGVYLALAVRLEVQMITADLNLVRRVEGTRLSRFVAAL